eukprot:6179945-Pleurochrysis_carterae.AAC.3
MAKPFVTGGAGMAAGSVVSPLDHAPALARPTPQLRHLHHAAVCSEVGGCGGREKRTVESEWPAVSREGRGGGEEEREELG